MAVQFSPTMQAYMSKAGIKPNQVCYLTICKGALDRILSGDKKVEFREYNGHYVKRFFSVKDNEIADAKPYTHLLLQAGYSPTSPRALVKISDIRVKLPDDTEPQSAIGKAMYAEAKAEGFELDDAWIGIALGAVVHSE
nr:hypothetical protein [uncultured Porphyromonas sp.]